MATTTRHQIRTHIHALNDDILLRIFDYLDYDDKIRLGRTCTRWRRLLAHHQLAHTRAIRLGQFLAGGYQVTSGLQLRCRQHNHDDQRHSCPARCQRRRLIRRETGTLFNESVVHMPADMETQCYSINRYDYLHRALKFSAHSITMLSLGRLQITYRLLMALTSNLPQLEHLELIDCASKFEKLSPARQARLRGAPSSSSSSSSPPSSNSSPKDPLNYHNNNNNNNSEQEQYLPSVESFNNRLSMGNIIMGGGGAGDGAPLALAGGPNNHGLPVISVYNQHDDEQLNMQERLIRSTLVKNCQLVQEARRQRHWSRMKHLLVRGCNLLNEFSLCLILAITNRTLDHLVVESNQYLTGEFLNYCGPQLETLQVRDCPMLRPKFVEDLNKLRRLLAPTQPQPPTSTSTPTPRQSSQQLNVVHVGGGTRAACVK